MQYIISFILVFSSSYSFSQGVVFAGTIINQSTTTQSMGVKNFRDWKAEKILIITNKMSSIKSKMDTEKNKKKLLTINQLSLSEQKNIDFLERQLSQEQWNLEIAQELSVTDYLALYIAQNPGKNKFQEAAANLGSSDVAELIESYVKNMTTQQPILPTQATQSK